MFNKSKFVKAVLEDRLILFPAMLVTGLVILLMAVDISKSESIGDYRGIVADPVPGLARSIEKASWEICPSVREGSTTDELLAALLNIENGRAQILQTMRKDMREAGEHRGDITYLLEIETAVQAIRKALPASGVMSAKDVVRLQPKLSDLQNASYIFNHAISETHKAEVENVLDRFSQNENVRSVLELMVFLCGLALVFALWDAMRRYKNNADRARAAERVNALFAAALESTRVGVLIRDMRAPRRPVVFLNKAFTDLTGYDYTNVGEGSSEFLFGYNTDQGSIAAYRRAINLHENKTLNLMLYRKNGEPFWSEWHLSPVLAADGALTHYVSLFTDTSGIRKVQEELIEAKQMAEHGSAVKTNFLAMMSHEIRTPINGILGVLKLVAERPLDDEQKHLLSIAITSSQALHGIINDILDFAKIEAGKIDIFPDVFNIHALIDEVTSLGTSMIGTKPVIVETDISQGVPVWVRGDEGRIRQILLNLVSNAIKFTETGCVSIRARTMMEQDKDGKPGVLARFEVQDTGIGISAEDQTRLFKEFSQVDRSFTRRFGGSGLGLAICRRLVLMMNGELGVESQPTKGSRFWFMIPLETAPENEIPEQASAGAEQDPRPSLSEIAGQKTILLVEDNEVNRMVAGRYLQKIGFAYDEAANGIEAIEKAKAKPYDLILMDVSMPEMDGMLATCHIRALEGHNARVPIIALTAHAMAGDRELCLAAGMSDYLSKPVEFAALVRALERWLRLRIGSKDEGKSSARESYLPLACDLDRRPDFDSTYLSRMREELGESTVRKVTDVFIDNVEKRISDLRAEDIQKVIDTAHFMKSSAANCGLMRFSNIMARIENTFAEQTPERRLQLVAEALAAFEAGVAKLKAYCAQSAS